MIIMMMMVLLH